MANTTLIQDESIIYFFPEGETSRDTINFIINTWKRKEDPAGNKLFLEFKGCPCDSNLMRIRLNPNAYGDLDTRRTVARTTIEDEEDKRNKDLFKYNPNRSFLLGPFNGLLPPGPINDVLPALDATPDNLEVVKVAIIDSGIDLNHESLQPKIWVNPNTDNTCLEDDKYGYDFGNILDPLIRDRSPIDYQGHGTHVAGIVSHELSDELLRIMALKITQNREARINLFDALCALKHATVENADIINLSWGYYAEEMDSVFYQLLKEAGYNNITIVTSAGNGSVNTDDCPHWPSGFSRGLSNVVSVAALNGDQSKLADYSNYGPKTVTLMAAGTDIISTIPTNSCDVMTGTSMAAPYATHAIVLLKHNNPSLSPEMLIDKLVQNATPIDENRIKNKRRISKMQKDLCPN